ncbi:MAG: glycosyltransferase family 2 protein [Patescibacteria group bacterium]
MDLSIIIVSYNTVKLTHDCVASLYRSLDHAAFKFEIIVVDNVSTDGTRQMIGKKFPKVRLINNRENVGFGRANNQGIRASKGEYILLLNSDTVVLNSSIGKLYSFAKQHTNAFVGGKLLNADRSPQTSCGPFFSLPVVFASLFLKSDILGITRWSPERTRKVDWVSGACMIAPKKLFMNDLLFDEQIFMYMEEIDLLYRARKKGYSTYFYHRALIVHLGAGSSQNKRKGPVLNIYRGLLTFYGKYKPEWQLSLLKTLLKTKALIAILISVMMGRAQLKETYAEAYKLV